MRTIQHWIAGSETTGASTRFGDTHAHSLEGVRFYTRGKAVISRRPDAEYPQHHRKHMRFPTAT
jgi:hypothetical protein